MLQRQPRWGPDVLAVVFAVACSIGLAVLLALEDGKPVFSWYGVTLNALVALLATCSKSALLVVVAESTSQWKWILFSRDARPLMDFERIDSASRGPFGSLKLLWSQSCNGA